MLTTATGQVGGAVDLDALIDYIIEAGSQPFSASIEGRITRN